MAIVYLVARLPIPIITLMAGALPLLLSNFICSSQQNDELMETLSERMLNGEGGGREVRDG